MQEAFAEDRHGRRRRLRRGDVLQDGERWVIPATFMDSRMHDALVAQHRVELVQVVDGCGATETVGHRPGHLYLADTGLDDTARVAYAERTARMDYRNRDAAKKKRPDDDDEEDDDGKPKSERQWREAMARKAAQATIGSDAQPTLDELKARADAAYAERVARLTNGWRRKD